ncbi:hypothetical protein ACHMW4_03975 [Mesorhizobium sp. UC22_110]|uniref:hypothetical protein n=1 Tax=unclassified Mesorhizobium TaxID=325217 RepID=UPI003672BD57
MSTKNIRGPGRPSVDSDLLRFRAERDVINSIDAFAAEQADTLNRPEAIRRIIRDWLISHGYLKASD